MGATPHSWLETYLGVGDENPMLLQLRDAGHDLWFTYSRGTTYSNVHKEYEYDSKEFWDFSWEDAGVGDIKAALSYVNARTNQKVAIMGYSMGTTQIFSALALDYQNFYRDRTYKVVQIAPCTITEPSLYKAFNTASVTALDTMGIYEIGGPTWYKTVVKVRKVMGINGIRGIMGGGWGTILKQISMKSFYHYAQNAKEGRFQRYSDNYWTPIVGKTKTDLYDLSQFD